MRIELGIITAMASLLAAAPLAAHHAFSAEFDKDQPIKLRGTITRMDWVNPHSWLYVDVKAADGSVVNWRFEMGPPNGLLRSGWRKDSVKAGTEVVVEGSRAKNGGPVANARIVTFADGKEMFTAGSSPDTK